MHERQAPPPQRSRTRPVPVQAAYAPRCFCTPFFALCSAYCNPLCLHGFSLLHRWRRPRPQGASDGLAHHPFEVATTKAAEGCMHRALNEIKKPVHMGW